MTIRRNPITRAWALYGPGGLIYRGKPSEAQVLIEDAYADWKVALAEALRNGDEKKPPRPKFILVAEMSDGSWLEVNPSDGKLVSRKETPQSRLGLQQRIQALLAGVRAYGGGQAKIVGFTYSPGAAPRVSTATTAPVREIRATMAAPVALGAAALKAERAAFADGVAAQAHRDIGYDKVTRVFTVPGAEAHPGFPSRAVAALWRKKILHDGPVRLGTEGSWVVPEMPRRRTTEKVQIEAPVLDAKGRPVKDRAGRVKTRLVWSTQEVAARPGVFPTYKDAWGAYKEWMKQQGEEEKAKKEHARTLAQSLTTTRSGGLRAISAKAAAAMHAEGLGLAPATFAHTTEYRGLRMIVSADGWVEIPGLKRKPSRDDPNQRLTVLAPSVEAAKALIDAARDAQAARLGKTVANPRHGRLPRQARTARIAARSARSHFQDTADAPPKMRAHAQRIGWAATWEELPDRGHHHKREKPPRERPPWRRNPQRMPLHMREWQPPAIVPWGARIEEVAQRLVEIADARGMRVATTFNTQRVYADPGERAADVLRRFR